MDRPNPRLQNPPVNPPPNRRNDNRGRRVPAVIPENQIQNRITRLSTRVFEAERRLRVVDQLVRNLRADRLRELRADRIRVQVRTERRVDREVPPPYVPDDVPVVDQEPPAVEPGLFGHLWEPIPFNPADWVVPEVFCEECGIWMVDTGHVDHEPVLPLGF